MKAYGADTIRAIITYKWKIFASREIYSNAAVYMLFLVTFTTYAILLR